VLDEPTNDLDVESLELLEQAIQDFQGTVILVSHDRTFVDNVVTQTVAPLGDGRWKEYVGGYSDWLQQRPKRPEPVTSRPAPVFAAPAPKPAPKPKSKLSFKDQRELDGLPAELEALEVEQKALAARMSASDYGRSDAAQIATDGRRMAEIETLLVKRLERWEALEAAASPTRPA
jgi:ATP-binding cassette subfamily F protein uup